MKLYKNVDICDLESILEKGVLSANKCGNYNWDEEKRVENSKDVVYMFKPTSEFNSFPSSYGVALLEIAIDDSLVKENKMEDNDVHYGEYIEYIADMVNAESIQAVYIPEIFKKRINLPDNIMEKITWCGFEAKYLFDYNCELSEIKEIFAETASINWTGVCNFFRGTTPNRRMIDVKDVKYTF